jgi:hypothetical protein
MKLVITWISFLLLSWSTMAFAAGSEEPNLVKFKSGGSVTASYKQYEGDKVTIYLFDPRDGILVVSRSFIDEPPQAAVKAEVKQKPVSKVKVKKRWSWKRRS